MWGVLPLLEKLGIRVLAKITGDARYGEIAYAHRAKLNVMICSKALINMATKMQERYGIPYIEASIYGVEDINNCCGRSPRPAGRCNDLQGSSRSADCRRNRQADRGASPLPPAPPGQAGRALYRRRQELVDHLRRQDLGIKVVATSTKKSTEEDKARIKDLLGKDGIMMQKGNAQELLKVIAKTNADMLIAGGRNQYTALKARIPFLDINQERHHPYAGYLGMIEMAKELDEPCTVRFGSRCGG
jgi:nitrogenase molybdenum-cofactor synthesis protein NifE